MTESNQVHQQMRDWRAFANSYLPNTRQQPQVPRSTPQAAEAPESELPTRAQNTQSPPERLTPPSKLRRVSRSPMTPTRAAELEADLAFLTDLKTKHDLAVKETEAYIFGLTEEAINQLEYKEFLDETKATLTVKEINLWFAILKDSVGADEKAALQTTDQGIEEAEQRVPRDHLTENMIPARESKCCDVL
jgi:hypothetical protein